VDVAAVVEEFSRLLGVPTTVEDVEGRERCSRLIAEMLARRGLQTRLVGQEGAAPMVVGTLDVGARDTVALYSHYDAQPVRQPDWANDPWTPTLYDGRIEDGASRVSSVADWRAHDYRIYARCASDDKAPTQALCSALDLLGGKTSVNLLVVTEGEEECGSPNFRSLLSRVPEVEGVAGWLILDGPVHTSGRQQVVLGARGVVTLQMTVYGPSRTLHSGHYGNWVPNPAMRLVHLIASMRDSAGRVTVRGFGEHVLELTELERQALVALPESDIASLGVFGPEDGASSHAEAVMRPAINLHGIQAGHVQREATNAIMQSAGCSFDVRLVPDQTIEGVKRAIERHVADQGFLVLHTDPTLEQRRGHERIVRLDWGEGYEPSRTPLDSPFAQRLVAACGPETLVNPMLGGSVPIRKIAAENVAILPIANPDNNQHGTNENIRVSNLVRGIELYARVLSGL
jgi:acetylornithine deacetylase/succinyl-diaminopimelate desuccinylase-like protein